MKSQSTTIFKTAGASVLVLLLTCFVSLPAGFAEGSVEADLSNDTTGYNSANSNEVNVNNNTSVNVTNTANVKNEFNLKLNTGHNSVSQNTEAGDVTTGDINVQLDLVNEANSGEVMSLASLNANDVSVSASNTNTGANSANDNTHNFSSNLELNLKNRADIDNKFDFNVDTGHNTLDKNTKVGSLRTGNIVIGVNVNNRANVGGTSNNNNNGGGSNNGGTTTGGGIAMAPSGVGGDFLPLPTQTTLSSQPTYKGMGGGYFAAGNSLFLAQGLIFFLIALLIFFYPPFSRVVLSDFLRHLQTMLTARREEHE